jgi:hypothetical protein
MRDANSRNLAATVVVDFDKTGTYLMDVIFIAQSGFCIELRIILKFYGDATLFLNSFNSKHNSTTLSLRATTS